MLSQQSHIKNTTRARCLLSWDFDRQASPLLITFTVCSWQFLLSSTPPSALFECQAEQTQWTQTAPLQFCFGGLACAIALKTRHGFHDFLVLEKSSEVGGTWNYNRYPGCGSDVPVHLYSLTTDLNPNWSHNLCHHDEIREYCREVPRKHSFTRHICFDQQVVSSEWDTTKQLWHVAVRNLKTGELHHYNPRIVIAALGAIGPPSIPEFKGLHKYTGVTFHSARWRPDVLLKGKRVAVIGSGASATQLVPMIAEELTTLVTQFCGTPAYMFPSDRAPYPEALKWMFRYVPLFINFWRFLLVIKHELVYLLLFKFAFTRNLITEFVSKNHIKSHAPPQYLDKLLPNYSLGCRRLVFDTNYLSSLHRPNLTPTWDGISGFYEDGIITKKGERIAFDVVIFATGFKANCPFQVVGSQGKTIQNYYDLHNGGKAYRGILIPSFPNFFVIGGPNSGIGHTSFIFAIENQVNYIMQLLQPILNGVTSSLEVTSAATDTYNNRLQQRMESSVYVQCRSWYRKDGNGRVTAIFPFSGLRHWWWLRRPDWSHFSVPEDGKGRWTQYIQKQEWARFFKSSSYVAVIVACLMALLSGRRS
ncbi:hypothetical protein AX16_010943 [Volvariella volvacea WC 439]|nr:hypothetical protein AX16_010943 [Volvariella volvacea WC 439]